FERRNSRSHEALLDQVIAVPHVLIADEAEKVIDDATARWGDLDLLQVGAHTERLAEVVGDGERTLLTPRMPWAAFASPLSKGIMPPTFKQEALWRPGVLELRSWCSHCCCPRQARPRKADTLHPGLHRLVRQLRPVGHQPRRAHVLRPRPDRRRRQQSEAHPRSRRNPQLRSGAATAKSNAVPLLARS